MVREPNRRLNQLPRRADSANIAAGAAASITNTLASAGVSLATAAAVVAVAVITLAVAATAAAQSNGEAQPGAATQPKSRPRPNIVVILSDDMGFSDLGCYGGEIQTPNLDSLAEQGLRFTQFYNNGRCCPTRASLLTGLHPHQAGIGHMMEDRGHDGYRGDLNRNCVTIAEVLGGRGYGTYAVGKWHVTRHVRDDGPKANWPLQRGFERFYGTITGAGSFFDPGTLCRDNRLISPLADAEYQPRRFYYTDAITDHAVKFLADHHRARPDQPSFLYVAYTAAHWPMHALEEDVAKYRGKYDAGYEPIRRARYQRLKQLGLIKPEWSMSPQWGDWEKVEHKAWEARCMEVYAAMIDRMDQGIGRIVAELKREGRLDDTLILFLQDNGGCQEPIGREARTARPDRPTLPPIAADAIRLDVIPKQNRAGVPTQTGPTNMPGPEDTYIAYGQGWANVSNTPLREYKHFVHEGGISTPLIAHWPRGIARRGQLEHTPGHLIDIMATCVDLAGAAYPERIDERAIKPLEGRSLAPLFSGRPLEREALYWEHEGNRAVREGRWKLVAKENRAWELYDIDRDRTEQHDLATSEPDRVRQMAAKWDSWAKQSNVLPLGGWRAAAADATKPNSKRLFELKGDAALARDDAPQAAGLDMSIDVTLDQSAPTGVLVAHGGVTHGYSLYLVDSKLHFATRHEGTLTTLAAAQPLPSQAKRITVVWRASGEVRATADGAEMLTGRVPGSLRKNPIDGLTVARDGGDPVGDYPRENRFTGRIESVRIELAKPK